MKLKYLNQPRVLRKKTSIVSSSSRSHSAIDSLFIRHKEYHKEQLATNKG